MATPGQLIEALSNAIGVPAKTVFLYDRILSEAGVRSKGGRGRSAAAMTARDAANLLIATISSPVSGPSVTGSLDQWKKYSGIICGEGDLDVRDPRHHEQVTVGKWQLPFFKLEHLTNLPEKHTLGDVLTALISSFMDNSFSDTLGDDDDQLRKSNPIRLTLSAPTPIAEILIGLPGGYETHYYYPPDLTSELSTGSDLTAQDFVRFAMRGWGPSSNDLRQHRWVTTRTIVALAHALRGDDLLVPLLKRSTEKPV